jgi:hypothetical protein
MIAFMVLSAPRSGSTWASNWLTTGAQLCLHDPILENRVEDLDHMENGHRLGLACTALPLLTDWVNQHRAPKVILHRPMSEVNASMERIGLSALPKVWNGLLEQIEGFHCQYQDLFRPGTARAIWMYLCPQLPFDRPRHALLSSMHIDPHFPRVRIDPDRTREFRAQIQRALA